jgi:hypothetical protein
MPDHEEQNTNTANGSVSKDEEKQRQIADKGHAQAPDFQSHKGPRPQNNGSKKNKKGH